MRFIYKNDNIPEAIAKALLENEKLTKGKENRLHQSDIQGRIVKIFSHEISYRQLRKNLLYMINDDLLQEDDPTGGKRGSKVYYSLTNKAKEKYNLKILGSDERVRRRKNLYRLLIFFEIFKTSNPVTRRQLYRFLKQIGMPINSLEVAKDTPQITHFRRLKGVEIIRWIQGAPTKDPDEAFYHVVIPGFTAEEFTSYLEKLRKGKEPRPFPSYTGITDVPFARFEDYSESEIADAIDSFRKGDLIKPINDVFPKEMRYNIADESLISYIKDVWLVHDVDLHLLFERLVFCGKPKNEDINALRLMYGEKIANGILVNTYDMRKMSKDQENKEEEVAKEFIKDLARYRTSLVQDIVNRHQEVIKKYEIPNELIKEIYFQPFMSSQN